MVRLIYPVTDETLYYDAGEGLAGEQDTNLAGVPVTHGSVVDRYERAESGLHTGVAEVESVEGVETA